MTLELTNYRKKTIAPIEGLSITVRESVGMDIFDRNSLYAAMSYSRKDRRVVTRVQGFADAVLRSEVSGDLGFTWPDVDSNGDVLDAAFEEWQKLPNTIITAWANALSETNSPNE